MTKKIAGLEDNRPPPLDQPITLRNIAKRINHALTINSVHEKDRVQARRLDDSGIRYGRRSACDPHT